MIKKTWTVRFKAATSQLTGKVKILTFRIHLHILVKNCWYSKCILLKASRVSPTTKQHKLKCRSADISQMTCMIEPD